MDEMRSWLQDQDWSTGELDEYQSRLSRHFDSPGHLLEQYCSSDGQRLCRDLGISDPGHCAFFERWLQLHGCVERRPDVNAVDAWNAPDRPSSAGALGRLDMFIDDADWSVGSLTRYSAKLAERFDSPGQVAELYSARRADGSCFFDCERFFADLEVANLDDRRFFSAWFSSSGKRPASTAPLTSRAANIAPPGLDALTPRPCGVGGGSVITAAVEEWLLNADWCIGVLQGYAGVFADAFDNPEQMLDAYVRENGCGKVFDDRVFFEDFGIKDPEHRNFFLAWFAAQGIAAQVTN